MTISEPPKFRRYAAEERAAMLVKAGLECLGEGGITAFTIDNICKKAEASRGLIAHHFGSKDGLLAAVYEAAYEPMLQEVNSDPPLKFPSMLKRIFGVESYSVENLRIWLALWGEFAVNPKLRAAHQRNYGSYKAAVEAAIEEHCFAHGLKVDAAAMAASVIALADGFWLEQCIDPEGFDSARALAAAQSLLEPLLGKLEDADES
ncbi:TetR family transcriptional regulator C-terminal domain-containing protein [Xinfangfangia sp. CPCC 101601]|uniref:TetR family transcriptional regulator C-terminal domain-containing protein n=1 Tax=Pseudogemmobacter lacusdianii TaxID=3069608 RepID=A0ABU0VX45_9RHOB|nr:TetR family transcriptional regulator C-terminal domain-containing protein [Xinfangfangia sp. CPCC 101601]MDQ2066334.1 TetR family transcriptional regulator C-terminal domain-containing protein [Xinfangfangia sp. CPCC 101601]